MEEEKKKSNAIINTLIIIVLLIVSVFIYSKYVGTRGIRVHEYRITSEKIPTNFSGIKIIYFSDFLYSGSNEEEMITDAVEKINELNPDIILFGGGLISKGYKLKEEEKLKIIENFTKLEARLGKYATLGSNDINIEEILTNSGFSILNNAGETVLVNENMPICLIGVGSYIKGSYNLETSFEIKSTNPTCYTVMFTHESDIIDKVKALPNKPDLLLAGNSLGGEIKIPFYGGLFRNEGSMNYYEETYNIDNIEIYISSGFGTSETGSRLFNKPSFNLFRLKSLQQK